MTKAKFMEALYAEAIALDLEIASRVKLSPTMVNSLRKLQNSLPKRAVAGFSLSAKDHAKALSAVDSSCLSDEAKNAIRKAMK
jgi:hypothetical protein